MTIYVLTGGAPQFDVLAVLCCSSPRPVFSYVVPQVRKYTQNSL